MIKILHIKLLLLERTQCFFKYENEFIILFEYFWGKFFRKVKNGQKKCPKIKRVDLMLQKHALAA
jgi:hypothetical protein